MFYDTESDPAAFPQPHTVGNIAAFLTARLAAPLGEAEAEENGADDVPLLWPSHKAQWDAPVRRLIFALEWTPGLKGVVKSSETALFLHRPFDVSPGDAPGLLAVFASHTGFDACLTTGYNPALARALSLTNTEPVRDALKNDAVVGMVGDLPHAPTGDQLSESVRALFGGVDATDLSNARRVTPVLRVAVMSALRPNLVALAADAGATVYVTGQLRQAARNALRERDMCVIAVGHRRSEWWGLRQLRREIGLAFPGVAVSSFDGK